jgi:hypothetical protein
MALGEESLLSALAAEVRDLRFAVTNSRRPQKLHEWKGRQKIKTVMGKDKRAEVWEWAQEHGITTASWGNYLNTPLPEEIASEASSWGASQWIDHLAETLPMLAEVEPHMELDLATIERVRSVLPAQPWATGVHRDVAKQLALPLPIVRRAIQALIKEGAFLKQINGELVEDEPA